MRILFGCIGAVVGSVVGCVLGYLLAFVIGDKLPAITSGMEYENAMAYMLILAVLGFLVGPIWAVKIFSRRAHQK